MSTTCKNCGCIFSEKYAKSDANDNYKGDDAVIYKVISCAACDNKTIIPIGYTR